jgi:hypothetical protein
VDNSISYFIDVHDGTTAHTLIGCLTVADDRGHVAAVWVKGADDAADSTSTDVETDEMIWFHLATV